MCEYETADRKEITQSPSHLEQSSRTDPSYENKYPDEDMSWRECFRAPSPPIEENSSPQGRTEREQINYQAPDISSFLKAFGLDSDSRSPSPEPVKKRNRRFLLRSTPDEEKAAEAEDARNKRRKGPSTVNRQECFEKNVYFLLAKYGKALGEVSTDDAKKKEKGKLKHLRQVRLWWSCDKDWTITSVAKDFSPWQMTKEEVKEEWSKLVENVKGRLPLSYDLAEMKEALDDEAYLERDWEQYNSERMMIWQKRAMDLDGSVLNSLLGPGVQLFAWSNNSCTYDAMISIFPHLCHFALENGLYVGGGRSFSKTNAAYIVAALFRLTKKRDNTERGRMYSWTRHLAQDLYEYGTKKRVHRFGRWKAYESNSYLDLNEVLLLFPELIGTSYIYYGIPAIFCAPDVLYAKLDNIFPSHEECTSLAEIIYYSIKELPITENVRSGIYIVQMGDFEYRQGGGTPKISKFDRQTRNLLRTNEPFTFAKDRVQYRMEIVAQIGFRDSHYNHFVFVVWKSKNTIIYHYSLRNRGKTKSCRPSDVYASTNPLIIIPSFKVFIAVTKLSEEVVA